MTTQLILRFNNADELLQVLQLLKNNGLDRLAFQPPKSHPRRKKTLPQPEKKEWAFGIGNLGGKLDHLNIRDYAYED